MRKIILATQISLVLLILSSCGSTKMIQREVSAINSNLFYELTSPEYIKEKSDTIYLDFINYSNLNYNSKVKKTTSIVVPLIVYNFQGSDYKISLGEKSLTQTYCSFLTDALLAECNSSTPIALLNSKKGKTSSAAYRLEVTVLKNSTESGINIRNHFIGASEDEYDNIYLYKHNTNDATTHLIMNAKLKKGDKCYLDKDYETLYNQPKAIHNSSTITEVSERCVDLMAESLSQATKQLVEQICQELPQVISNRNSIEQSANQ